MENMKKIEGYMVHAEPLKDFCTEAFASVGVPDDSASIIADSLVEADLRGVETHGVTRLAGYVRMLREGKMNPRPNIKVVKEGPAMVLLDADNASGIVAGVKAMEITIKKAKEVTVSVAGVRNSTHCGALAYFTEMAIEHGMVGFMTVMAPPTVPPYGGKTPVLSTSPWSFAIPAGQGLPILLDMATTVVAGGKIVLAAKKGEKIPRDWALDQDGMPTDDPGKALKGFFQWIGGPKGYGLGVVAEVLSGVLVGGPFGRSMPPFTHPYGSSQFMQGHFQAALNISHFMPLSEFTSRVDQLIRELKSSERIEGVEEIFLPGEIEWKKKAQRLKSGIPLSSAVWNELKDLRTQLRLRHDI